MESIRSVLHAIAVFLSVVLDPVIRVLTTFGVALRRAMNDMHVPQIVQPVGIIAAWFVVILLLIRFLKGATRLAALLVLTLLLLRIYRVLPDI